MNWKAVAIGAAIAYLALVAWRRLSNGTRRGSNSAAQMLDLGEAPRTQIKGPSARRGPIKRQPA